MLNSQTILRMHDEANLLWHHCESYRGEPDDLSRLSLAQHRANYELWHEEDDARCPNASDTAIATVKHAIDRHNQSRNDLVEQIDEVLFHEAGPQNEAAPLHSETPGLIIDRLSILALKIYHTAEEAHRPSASEAHRHKNAERLLILERQRADLAACLDSLWQQVLTHERRFKLYRQMKMYNDPELNPVLYNTHAERRPVPEPAADPLPTIHRSY